MALIQGPKSPRAGCKFGPCKHLEFVPEFSCCVPQCVGLQPWGQSWELSIKLRGSPAIGVELLVTL